MKVKEFGKMAKILNGTITQALQCCVRVRFTFCNKKNNNIQ